jgi:hypothetical protein
MHFDPQFDWLCKESIETAAGHAKKLIQAYYAHAAEAQSKPAATYFLEKFPTNTALLLRNVYAGTRQIFLLRDPRDAVCSILDFMEREGKLDTMVRDGMTREDFIEAELKLCVARYRTYCRDWSEDKRIIIAYEDLIRTPGTALLKILSALRLDASESVIAQMLDGRDAALFGRHATSKTPAASIGRWRRDLSPQMQAKADEICAELPNQVDHVDVLSIQKAGAPA